LGAGRDARCRPRSRTAEDGEDLQGSGYTTVKNVSCVTPEGEPMSLVQEIAPGLAGLEQLRALMAGDRKPGILHALDFDFIEVEPGRAVFAGIPGDHAYNPIGMVHGGYAATLLDSACGCAVHSRLTATQAYTTLDLSVSYHKPITRDTGLLRAEGRVRSLGRRVGFAEASLTDSEGRLYATATSTLLIFDRAV
jgi:uncharacterized protein (TIGR00369 family)